MAWRDPWGDSCQWYIDHYHDGICDFWAQYCDGLFENCPAACGLESCNPDPATTTAAPTTTTTCIDDATWVDLAGDNCQWWSNNECGAYYDVGQWTACPASCGLCGGKRKEAVRRLGAELLLKTPARRMDGQELANTLIPKETLVQIATQGLGSLSSLPPKSSFPDF